MPRISVLLSRDEEQALIELALAEMRVPNVEARFLLRQELIRRGVLKTNLEPSSDELHNTVSASSISTQDVANSRDGK